MSRKNALNGSVQAQGIRVNAENWLAIGSKEWDETPEKIKAWAYQAALATGWTDAGLKVVMLAEYPHFDDYMCDLVLDSLKEWSVNNRLETT